MSAPSTASTRTERPDPFAHPLVPHLIVDGAAAAIDFYVEAFGARELMRLPGPDGRLVHGCVEILGIPVMLMDANPEWDTRGPADLGGTPVVLHLTVEDVDLAFARAVAAGATVRAEPQVMFWGDRYSVVQDPFGHAWAIATPGEPADMDTLVQGAAQAGC